MHIGLFFPGYGAQYVGMGKELYDTERVMQECFEEASDCVQINFVKLIFASSDADLSTALHASLTLFIMGISSVELLREARITPQVVCGADLVGFLSALYAAQSINLPDGIYVLRKWAELFVHDVQEYPELGLVMHTTDHEVRGTYLALVDHVAQRGERIILSRVTPDMLYVRGEEASLTRYRELCMDKHLSANSKLQPWSLSHGIYSPLHEEAAAQLWQYLEKIDVRDPSVPVLDPFEGDPIDSAEHIRIVLRQILLRTFRLDRIIAHMHACENLIVALPSSRLIGTLRTWLPEVKMHTLENVSEYKAIQKGLGKSLVEQ